MDVQEEEMLLLILLLRRRRIRREQKASQRKVWVRKLLRLRRKKGAFQNLIREMRISDRESHFRFFRMSPERFDHLLTLVTPFITKEGTNFRKPISAAERLAVTLRFLASGDSQISLHYLFRISTSSLSLIKKLWNCLWEPCSPCFYRPKIFYPSIIHHAIIFWICYPRSYYSYTWQTKHLP